MSFTVFLERQESSEHLSLNKHRAIMAVFAWAHAPKNGVFVNFDKSNSMGYDSDEV